MKIVLMSDSHGRNDLIDMIIKLHPDAKMYLHCGDIECDERVYPMLTTVKGNNDYFADYPTMVKLKLGTYRVLMLHSHTCPYRNKDSFMAHLAKQYECDTVFYGHSHVAKDEIVDGVRLINPGSLYYSRDGRPVSYCVIRIDSEMNVEFQFAPFK
ncbi:MAG: metallophosphoesterase family protein [Traorella sp.]